MVDNTSKFFPEIKLQCQMDRPGMYKLRSKTNISHQVSIRKRRIPRRKTLNTNGLVSVGVYYIGPWR